MREQLTCFKDQLRTESDPSRTSAIVSTNYPQIALSLFNPIVYLVSGFRWSFYEVADVGSSVAMIALFLAACLTLVWWIFKTGYRVKS